MESVLVSRRYVVRGRVQGVGFRIFVQAVARRQGLDGQVINRNDGSVEAMAVGDAKGIGLFEQALRQGPPHASIEAVEVTDCAPIGLGLGFLILS